MRRKIKEENIKCDICGYQNHKCYVERSGVCHLCGKILDEKAYFKAKMRTKLRLWRNKRKDGDNWWNNQ